MSSSSLYLFCQYKKIEISSHWTEWKKKKTSINAVIIQKQKKILT